MALIKCPECGRENVSDIADSCPECGYPIKEHFEKIAAEIAKKESEEQEKIYQQQRIDNVQMPEKPKIKGKYIFNFILYSAFGFFGLKIGMTFGVICIFLFIVFGFCFAFREYNLEVDKYKKAQANFEQYKRDKIKEHDQEVKTMLRVAASIPSCPMCGSSYIERISGTSRAMSVFAFGLMSSKIGKQYKCKSCKHLW